MHTPQQAQLHARISGRVQGVGFRDFVERTAHGLGLTGWVRNCWDDTVETVAEGPRPALEQFEAALRRGPSLSHVETVLVTWGEATHTHTGFRIRSSV